MGLRVCLNYTIRMIVWQPPLEFTVRGNDLPPSNFYLDVALFDLLAWDSLRDGDQRIIHHRDS